MLLKATENHPDKKTKPISLRLILVVPFVLQIFAAVGLVGYLSFRNGQKAVNDLGNQLIDKASQQIDDHLDTYLALPHQLNQINVDAIASKELNLNDTAASQRYFWRQAKAFKNLSYIGYTGNDGREMGAGRWINGQDLLLYEKLPGNGRSSDYTADETGHPAKLVQTYNYDPLSEPWFKQTVAAGKPIWSRITAANYNNGQVTETAKTLATEDSPINSSIEYYVTASATSPLYDKNHKLLGLVIIDLLVTDISKFLRNIKVSPKGQVFIIERDGMLVGSSSTYPILHKVNNKAERFSVLNSPDPLIRSISENLSKKFKSFQLLDKNQELNITFNGEHHYI